MLLLLSIPAFAQWYVRPVEAVRDGSSPSGASPADVSFLLDAARRQGWLYPRSGSGRFDPTRRPPHTLLGVDFTDWSRVNLAELGPPQ